MRTSEFGLCLFVEADDYCLNVIGSQNFCKLGWMLAIPYTHGRSTL